MSRDQRPEEEALARLVLEVRELNAPNLDWDRVEARLMNEARTGTASARSFIGRLRWPALALAATASVVLFVPRQRPAAPTAQPKVVAQVRTGPLNGDTLTLGTRVSAGNQAVVVEHADRARWALEPRSTASVTDAGEQLTIRLERGALSANVVSNPKPETFAVEVGGTRVAVHGTAFRVERIDDRVLVEVTDGTVAIEPTSAHSDPSFLLRRGSRGSFGLDGRAGSVEGNASAVMRGSGPKSQRMIARAVGSGAPRPKVAPSASLPAPSAAVSVEPAALPTPAPPLPEQPSIAEIETGVSAAVELMSRCFRDKTQATDIRVSVSTGMTLSVAGDGTVQSVTFGPPLAPDVEDCSVAGLRNLAFAHSVEGATFTRILELKR